MDVDVDAVNSRCVDGAVLWAELTQQDWVPPTSRVSRLAPLECRTLGMRAWLLTTVIGHFGDDQDECVQARDWLDEIDDLVAAFDGPQLLEYVRAFAGYARSFMWDGL